MSMLMASNPSDAETSSDDISPRSQTLTFDDDALKGTRRQNMKCQKQVEEAKASLALY